MRTSIEAIKNTSFARVEILLLCLVADMGNTSWTIQDVAGRRAQLSEHAGPAALQQIHADRFAMGQRVALGHDTAQAAAERRRSRGHGIVGDQR